MRRLVRRRSCWSRALLPGRLWALLKKGERARQKLAEELEEVRRTQEQELERLEKEHEAALQRESAMASSTASDLQEEMRRVQRELQESNKGLEQLERTGVGARNSACERYRKITCGIRRHAASGRKRQTEAESFASQKEDLERLQLEQEAQQEPAWVRSASVCGEVMV